MRRYTPRNPYEWVNSPHRANEVFKALMDEWRIGLDVETTFGKEQRLCTVQLATAKQTWIVDAFALRDFGALQPLMAAADVLKIIHNAQFETHLLGKHGVRLENVYDTLVASRRRHGRDPKLKHKLIDVCQRELGILLDKEMQSANWRERPLTRRHLNYAAADAEVMLMLHDIFEPPQQLELGL
jgi:ATP-dependent Lhr-like helicase